MQALTKLEFDGAAIKAHTAARVEGSVVDSTKGWWLDHYWPHYRRVLSPDAIHHGYLLSSADPQEEHINERVHWSVIDKRINRAAYDPRNLPRDIPHDKIAAVSDEERSLF